MSSLFLLIPVFVVSIGAQVRLIAAEPDQAKRATRQRFLKLSYWALGLLLLLVAVDLIELLLRLTR